MRERDTKGAPELPDVTEVFVIRDSLVHNHVWEIEYDYAVEGGKMTRATPLEGFGDSKWKQTVDMTSAKTKPSGINAIPTRMDRQDARKILVLIVSAMRGLEAIGALLPQALNDHEVWPPTSERITLSELVKKIPE